MSYVLDALRRADAERQRGAVPHLHAQLQGPPDGASQDAPRAGWPLWAMAAMAVLVVALSAALAWTWWPAPSGVAGPPASSTPAGVGVAGAGPARGPGTAIGQAAAPPPREPAPRAAPPMPVDRSPPQPVARPDEPPPTLQPPPPGIVPASPARMAAAAAAQARVPKRQELPESVQRQLPSLVFGGATDSPAAASRMLIVNGQIFREGDEVSAGLVLEHIALRTARLRWRGQLFEVAY